MAKRKKKDDPEDASASRRRSLLGRLASAAGKDSESSPAGVGPTSESPAADPKVEVVFRRPINTMNRGVGIPEVRTSGRAERVVLSKASYEALLRSGEIRSTDVLSVQPYPSKVTKNDSNERARRRRSVLGRIAAIAIAVLAALPAPLQAHNATKEVRRGEYFMTTSVSASLTLARRWFRKDANVFSSTDTNYDVHYLTVVHTGSGTVTLRVYMNGNTNPAKLSGLGYQDVPIIGGTVNYIWGYSIDSIQITVAGTSGNLVFYAER